MDPIRKLTGAERAALARRASAARHRARFDGALPSSVITTSRTKRLRRRADISERWERRPLVAPPLRLLMLFVVPLVALMLWAFLAA